MTIGIVVKKTSLLKNRYLLPVLILALGGGIMALFTQFKAPPAEKNTERKAPIVSTSAIEMAPLTLSIDSHGLVKPRFNSEVTAQVSGEIVSINDGFVRGGFVKKGQVLAQIDPSDYQTALLEAQANVAAAQAALELEKARGKVAEAEWQQISNTKPSELGLRKPQLAQELSRYRAATAALQRAERNLERATIRAPYDALIEERHVGLGSFVTIGSPLGRLLSSYSAEIRLPVADKDLQFLQNKGVGAGVTLNAYYSGKPTQWQATIIRNESVIDNSSRMTYLVAEVSTPYQPTSANTHGLPLRFGTYVTADITGIELVQAARIPRHLINNGKVAVTNKQGTVSLKAVNIVREVDASAIVNAGLSDGDLLITSALNSIVDGMQITLPTSSAEKDVETISTVDQMAQQGE